MNKDEIFKIGFYLIVLYAVYKLLQKVGLFEDSEDRKSSALMSAKPLDVNYWKQYFKGDEKPTTSAYAVAIAKQIYKAKGTIYDTDGEALSAIKKLKTKSQVSYVSEIFSKLYTRDLGEYLDFMDDTNMALAFDYINRLKSK